MGEEKFEATTDWKKLSIIADDPLYKKEKNLQDARKQTFDNIFTIIQKLIKKKKTMPLRAYGNRLQSLPSA